MSARLRYISFTMVVLVAGCGGGSTTPSSSATATPTPTASPTPSSSATATPTPATSPVAATWTLGGATANMTAVSGQAPAQVSLSAYQAVSATLQFGAVATGNGTLNVSDALNNGDITPNTLPADTATAGTTPELYISVYNGGLSDVSFGANTPALTVTNTAGFAGATTCELDAYGKNGNGTTLSWFEAAGGGTVTGTTATVPTSALPGGSTVDFKPGQQIVAVACK